VFVAQAETLGENFMARLVLVLACVFLFHGIAETAIADDDFDGIIESRPEAKAGTWVIGGQSVKVTEGTRLEEENGPLTVGACAEVEIEDGAAEEIESEPMHKCGK
jgi:hypothetical protein